METIAGASFAATLALIGMVVVVAALLSGVVERWRLPQVAVFLVLGLALGPYGLRLVDLPLDSPILQAIATLALILVLFSDAVGVDVAQVRQHGRLAFLVLGPGTLLTAALIAVAAGLLLELPPAPAAILGAALASTDPVMMRGLLRGADVPAAARQALTLESGLNDVVLLPIVLVAMTLLGAQGTPALGRIAFDQLLLGPAAGVGIGFVGVRLLDQVRRRVTVRRDYESLYALGVAFTAYAAAEAVHGSGFLATFAAGLTIAATDAELCDCFLDFGQAAAEMFLLLTFVVLGSSLIWQGFSAGSGRGLAFAVAALAVRPAVLFAALARAGLDRRSRDLIVWYGPRALSSLLLVLLPVFAGLPDAERLFAPAALVVLLSVVMHGASLLLIGKRSAGGGKREPADSTPHPDMGGQPGIDRERITLAEVRRLREAGERIVLLDVRKERAYREAATRAQGAIRLAPDGDVAARAAELALPRHDWLVAYCA